MGSGFSDLAGQGMITSLSHLVHVPTVTEKRGRGFLGRVKSEGGSMDATDKVRISLTGNPFVDTGLSVIAALAGLDDIKDLSFGAMRQVYGNGTQLANWNSHLPSFSQVFGTNNPLFQTGYGYQKGKGPSVRNIAIYCGTLQAFLDAMSMMAGEMRCEACGSLTKFNFAQSCISVVKANGGKAPEDKSVGRDWFPLAGSLGSDAQALPACSRPVNICAKCLFAVHYLPLGLILLNGRLAVFQSTAVEFWYDLVRDIVVGDEGRLGRVMAGIYQTPGAKEGSRAVAKRLLALFRRLLAAKNDYELPRGASLSVWRFTNSTPPDCMIEEIPNPTLVFLLKAAKNNLDREVEHIIDGERKKELSLFRCITEQRDYPGLYPKGKWLGASPKLFFLYQTEVCARSSRTLGIARMIARQAGEGLKPKDLKRLQREEAFSDRSIRNQFRVVMTGLTQKGQFTLDDYIGLFPLSEDGSGITVRFDGWNLIRYYLCHADDPGSLPEVVQVKPFSSSKLIMLTYYAARIFRDYIEDRGRDRFITEVLGRSARGEIGVSWLENRFVRLAEKYIGFSYGAWEKFCKRDNGQLFVSELLFQMRLLWAEWIEGSGFPPVLPLELSDDPGLPPALEVLTKEVFQRHVAQRGLERYHRDVLTRLRKREIGLPWFRRRFVNTGDEASLPSSLPEEEWEALLKDDEGRPCGMERLFQIHLRLANLYREAK